MPGVPHQSHYRSKLFLAQCAVVGRQQQQAGLLTLLPEMRLVWALEQCLY